MRKSVVRGFGSATARRYDRERGKPWKCANHEAGCTEAVEQPFLQCWRCFRRDLMRWRRYPCVDGCDNLVANEGAQCIACAVADAHTPNEPGAA